MVRFDRVAKASWALLFAVFVVVAALAEMRILAQQPAPGSAQQQAQDAAAPAAQGNAPPPVVRTDISGDGRW